MSNYIPDYADLYEDYEAEQERSLRKYPKCDCCDKRILTERFYNFEGTYICEECIEDYLVWTDDYVLED